ncbi:MAG: hemerythrin domain-containing protein [Candidatus Bathyarchaeia archaeon]
MRATEALKEDHRVIEKVVKVLADSAEKLELGDEVSPGILEKAVDFIRTFADKCHHGKEETILFPTLEAKGIPRNGGPIAIMLQEHDLGRGFVRELAEAVERFKGGHQDAKNGIIANARGYAQLLMDHIWKEDNILFRLAEDVLTEGDHAQLLQRFEQIELERIGEGKHREYVELATQLSREIANAS